MPVRNKLNPGQPGTQRLLAEHASRLLCVHYHCDPARPTSVNPLETVVEESDRKPRPRRLRPEQFVALRIGWKEDALPQQVRQAGGRGNARRRLWEIRDDKTLALGPEDRIEEMHLLADDRKASANR
ncbi:MAG: hypothetical protein U0Z53_01545 [Blastocatellia bacterium]